MSDKKEVNLINISLQLASFLRGFDDSTIHVGAKEQFVKEFRRLLEIPVLNLSGKKNISYAQTLASKTTERIQIKGSDPLSILIHGLSSGIRTQLKEDIKIAELKRVLRIPLLNIYLKVTDKKEFLNELERIAQQGNFSILVHSGQTDIKCYECDTLLGQDIYGWYQCTKCQRFFEILHHLPVIQAFRVTFSFAFLKEVLELGQVETYQVEGEIHPVETEDNHERI